MASRIISVRIPQEVYEELRKEAILNNYKDVSELVRNIIRKKSLTMLKQNNSLLIQYLESMLKELKGEINE